MKQRCRNPKQPNFKNYGGRGIAVCEEWADSDAFVRWALANGYRRGLTIERVNNDGNYEPSNCTWVSRSEQLLNTRRTVRAADGTARFRVVVEITVPVGTFQGRMRRGVPQELATALPPFYSQRAKILANTAPVRLTRAEKSAWANKAEANGFLRATFLDRVRHGWSPEDAATTAPDPKFFSGLDPRKRNLMETG